MDAKSLLNGRKLPTLITDLNGVLQAKTNHKILRLDSLHKGIVLKYQILEMPFEYLLVMQEAVAVKAVMFLDNRYTVNIERHAELLVISITGMVVLDVCDGMLVGQTAPEYGLPIVFSPYANLKQVCDVASKILAGSVFVIRQAPMYSRIGSYGEKQSFYELISSAVAATAQSSCGNTVQLTGISEADSYRITATAKLFKLRDAENFDIPADIAEEICHIEELAEANYWLFSAHIFENGVMELTLDMPISEILDDSKVAESADPMLIEIAAKRISKLLEK